MKFTFKKIGWQPCKNRVWMQAESNLDVYGTLGRSVDE